MRFKVNSKRAFTNLEVVVVICMFLLVAFVFLPMLAPARKRAQRLQCVNNQKMIGTAYRMWAGDNLDKYPADATWHDLTLITNAGPYCWSNYSIMANELGWSPKLLLCPQDERSPANSFDALRNINISYFFAPGANENFPLSILGGDRNLAPGTTPKNDSGYSPADGTGNDVILQTNSPVCWSLRMHSKGNATGVGNILMGDGSVQQCSSATLRSDYIANAATPSNFPTAFDNSQSNFFRLIFP